MFGLVTLAFVVVLCSALSWFGWQYHAWQTKIDQRRAAIETQPERTLHPPGAVLLTTSYQPFGRTPYGPYQGRHYYGTAISLQEVVAFYERELPAHGWQPVTPTYIAPDAALAPIAWTKDGITLVLLVFDRPARYGGAECATGSCMTGNSLTPTPRPAYPRYFLIEMSRWE